MFFQMLDDSAKKKVAIYIDGSNLYFSIKKTFNLKINIQRLCQKLAGDNDIVKVNYYIAPLNQKTHPKQYTEQQKFFDSIRQIDKLNIIFGRLEKRKREEDVYYVKKASDVNLALDLALDAQKGIYDEAYLISNDGDFSGAVSSAIGFGKKVIYVAIGNRKSVSHHLKKVASKTFYITRDFIEDCKL